MPLDLVLYLIAVVGYRLIEYVVMRRTGSERRGSLSEWSRWLIMVPFALTVLGPLLEVERWGSHSGPLNWLVGAGMIAAATYFRSKGHIDLRDSYSMAVEHPQGGLVTTGLYAYVRHPLYLGNLCLFIGCPIFLGARLTWIATALGIIGILVRIRIEERLLLEAFPEYGRYRQGTAALIPRVY